MNRSLMETEMQNTTMQDTTAKSPTARKPVARQRLMIASLLGMTMLGAVQVLPAVALETMGENLGLDFQQKGLMFSLRILTAIPALLLIGHYAERPYKRHILFWGLMALVLGQILTAEAIAYGPLLSAMAISGVGFGVVEAIVAPLVAQLYPSRSAWALNIINGVFALGMVVGALSAGELLQAGYGWRISFWLWILPPTVCAFLYMTPRYPTPSPHADSFHVTPDVKGFLASPLFWLLSAGMILAGGCEAGLTSWAPNFVAEELGASARGGAWTTILYGSLMAVGRFGTGALVTRIKPFRLMVVSAVLCGMVMLGLYFVSTLMTAWVLFALGGLFVACFWPTLLAMASDHISIGSTSLFSLMAAAGVLGAVVVPWAIGALGNLSGLRAGIMMLPVLMAAMIVVLLVASRYMQRNSSAPQQ